MITNRTVWPIFFKYTSLYVFNNQMPLGPSFHYRFVQVSKLVVFSVLKFDSCSMTHGRPRNKYQLAGQQSSLPEYSLAHIWLKGPPVGSPSSFSIPWHRGVTCPCCSRSIHHLIRCHAVRITRGGSDWDSQTLCQRPLDCLPFLCARTRHWHDFDPWKHTITFITCGLGGFSHFVPWQDVQNEFWTEQLLLGTEERRCVHAHTPLHSQAPTLPSYYTIPFLVSAQMGHNLPTRHCENNLCLVPQGGWPNTTSETGSTVVSC